ncbi:hypothetical protein AB9P05_20935 [Roseivirga sp. BDSF3-8]|uniref:hypothetical protein n=1 Tax=Roseivirga sp. BDSF3-8 TaxID=3241598 RepID=UPI0035325600
MEERRKEAIETYQYLHGVIHAFGTSSKYERKCLSVLARYFDMDERPALPKAIQVDMKADRASYFVQLIKYARKGREGFLSNRLLKETGLRMGIDIFTIQNLLTEFDKEKVLSVTRQKSFV